VSNRTEQARAHSIDTLDEPSRNEQIICRKRIYELISSQLKILGALVCTSDGFEVAAQLPRKISAATMSAMSSSQLALSEAICAETGIQRCRNVVMEADAGIVLMMDIPNRGNKLLLTVLCQSDCILGQVLWAARQCAEETGAQLDAER
jgi:predicted regulator of Ras-like GTPase activity (Roadblock/LC7/MglB family)